MSESIGSKKERLVVGAAVVCIALAFLGWRHYTKYTSLEPLGGACTEGDDCHSDVCVVPLGIAGFPTGRGVCSRKCLKDEECPDDFACLPLNPEDETKVCLEQASLP